MNGKLHFFDQPYVMSTIVQKQEAHIIGIGEASHFLKSLTLNS